MNALTLARVNLLTFERRMIDKYGTKRFEKLYLVSEQITHRKMRRNLMHALWAVNGKPPVFPQQYISPEAEKREEKARRAAREAQWNEWETKFGKLRPTTTADTIRTNAKSRPKYNPDDFSKIVEPTSKAYITGVSAADLLRSVMAS